MKVFISWSETVSGEVAKILSKWLKPALQFVTPFISKEMRKGKNWRMDLATQLSETDFGIICLTRENLKSEWIHFEAGAISKNLNSTIYTFLFDVQPEEIVDPLDTFNHTIFDKADFKKLFLDLYSHGFKEGLTTLSEVEAHENFDDRWPDLEKKLIAIPKDYTITVPPKNDRDILVEVLQNVKALSMNMPNITMVKPLVNSNQQSMINLILCNVEIVDSNKLEFDIYIHNNSLKGMGLQTFLLGIDISHDFIGSGNITVEVIEGSSHCLPAGYSLHPNISFNRDKNHLRLTAKTGIGSKDAVVISSDFPGSKYCSIRLSTDSQFGNPNPDFKMNFANESAKTRTALCVFQDGHSTGAAVNFSHFVFNKNITE